jgi:hypothetical protein
MTYDEAIAAGWRFVHESGETFRAEKVIGGMVRLESARSLDELLAHLEVLEQRR